MSSISDFKKMFEETNCLLAEQKAEQDRKTRQALKNMHDHLDGEIKELITPENLQKAMLGTKTKNLEYFAPYFHLTVSSQHKDYITSQLIKMGFEMFRWNQPGSAPICFTVPKN